MDWLWLLLLGFGTGVYGVLVGAGGGFILGPVLLIYFDMEHNLVAGTVLSLVAVNSISGALAYRRMGLVDYRSALLLAAAAVPGSVIAPFVVTAVASSTFSVLFGLLLIALAIQLLVRPRVSEGAPRKTKKPAGVMVGSRQITTSAGQVFRYEFSEAMASMLNFGLGFVSGFFGTGGGFLLTPVLVSFFSFPIRVAVATSVFSLSLYTTVGAVTHASLGNVDWYPTFLWAGMGLVMGGQIGARLTGVVKGPWILRLLLVAVLALGIRLLIQGLRG